MSSPAPARASARLPLPEADERLARRLAAETYYDLRTVRRYLRGETVMRTTRHALEAAFRALKNREQS